MLEEMLKQVARETSLQVQHDRVVCDGVALVEHDRLREYNEKKGGWNSKWM